MKFEELDIKKIISKHNGDIAMIQSGLFNDEGKRLNNPLVSSFVEKSIFSIIIEEFSLNEIKNINGFKNSYIKEFYDKNKDKYSSTDEDIVKFVYDFAQWLNLVCLNPGEIISEKGEAKPMEEKVIPVIERIQNILKNTGYTEQFIDLLNKICAYDSLPSFFVYYDLKYILDKVLLEAFGDSASIYYSADDLKEVLKSDTFAFLKLNIDEDKVIEFIIQAQRAFHNVYDELATYEKNFTYDSFKDFDLDQVQEYDDRKEIGELIMITVANYNNGIGQITSEINRVLEKGIPITKEQVKEIVNKIGATGITNGVLNNIKASDGIEAYIDTAKQMYDILYANAIATISEMELAKNIKSN